MQREMFTPPGGPTYIPREYIVYLSNDDDKEWQGDKRRGLEQGLFHVLSERARELSGTTQLATKSFAVELRVDGTLNKGDIITIDGVYGVNFVFKKTTGKLRTFVVTANVASGATSIPRCSPNLRSSEANGKPSAARHWRSMKRARSRRRRSTTTSASTRSSAMAGDAST